MTVARFPLAVLTLLAAACALAVPAQAAPRAATDIVQLRPGVSLARGEAIVRAAHGRVTGRGPLIHGLAVRLPAGARARLAGDARVAAVSANARVRSQRFRPPSDVVDGVGMGTAYPASVLAPQSWDTVTGQGVGVAVIDTGIDGALPDFADAGGASRVVASVVTN